MGARHKKLLILLSMIEIAGLLFIGMNFVWAGESGVDTTATYEIVYEASASQAKTIRSAVVIEVMKIGSREFLVIAPPSVTSTPVRGYIDLEHVRSLLPIGSFE